MYLLDTNVLSEVIKPQPSPQLIGRLLSLTAAQLFASEITRYELRYGACLRPTSAQLWARLRADVLPLVSWLAVTAEVSARAGEIRAALRLAGREAGSLDPLIAATAATHGLTLATRNIRHFNGIDGLAVENWFAERENH